MVCLRKPDTKLGMRAVILLVDSSKKKKPKKGAESLTDQTVLMKKKQVKSLFEQFKLESVLNEIEKAESEKDIKKIIHYSTKL